MRNENEAEQRFAAALTELGLADPRPALRERLRVLRETNPAAFEQAKARFEDVVRTGGQGEVERWIEYGQHLGELTSPGRLYRIDASGRAAAWAPPLEPCTMLLHLPEDTAAPVLPVLLPLEMSPAQAATRALLVERKLAL